jgi:hypothetical protein
MASKSEKFTRRHRAVNSSSNVLASSRSSVTLTNTHCHRRRGKLPKPSDICAVQLVFCNFDRYTVTICGRPSCSAPFERIQYRELLYA